MILNIQKDLKMKKLLLAGACALAFLNSVTPAFAEHQHQDHSPAGVMGAHLHQKGEWMVSYYLDGTSQSGLRDGSDKVSTHDVLQTFGEVMTDMSMRMHMLEGMVGITDNLSLMVMGQYMEMEMTHEAHGGHGIHSMTKKGWGDTEVTALYGLMHEMDEKSMHSLHLNAGLSLPTGDTDEAYLNHHNVLMHLPYSMQFGSGTYDPILGLTYTGESGGWGWGSQILGTFRFGENNEGYRLGNKYRLNLWGSRALDEVFSASARLEGITYGNVHGSDAMMPPTSMNGAQPDGQGGEQLNAYIGLSATPALAALQGHKFAAEFGLPLYQHFDGPQLDNDYRFIASWKVGF